MALWGFINMLRPDTGTCLIPDQTRPFHIFPNFVFKILFNIIIPYTPGSAPRSLPFKVLRPKLCMHFSYLPRVPPSVSIALTTWRDAYRLLSSSVCIFSDQWCCGRVSFAAHMQFFVSNLNIAICLLWGTAVAQWLSCCATNRKAAGSIPAGISGFFIGIKSFQSRYGPGVDSASNRNEYQENLLGVKAVGA